MSCLHQNLAPWRNHVKTHRGIKTQVEDSAEQDAEVVGVRDLVARGYFIPGRASQRGCGLAPTFRVARCQTPSGDIDQNSSLMGQNQSKTPKVNMLRFGDVSFDFGLASGIQRSNRICSQDQRNIWPILTNISPKIVKISPKHQKSTC